MWGLSVPLALCLAAAADAAAENAASCATAKAASAGQAFIQTGTVLKGLHENVDIPGTPALSLEESVQFLEALQPEEPVEKARAVGVLLAEVRRLQGENWRLKAELVSPAAAVQESDEAGDKEAWAEAEPPAAAVQKSDEAGGKETWAEDGVLDVKATSSLMVKPTSKNKKVGAAVHEADVSEQLPKCDYRDSYEWNSNVWNPHLFTHRDTWAGVWIYSRRHNSYVFATGAWDGPSPATVLKTALVYQCRVEDSALPLLWMSAQLDVAQRHRVALGYNYTDREGKSMLRPLPLEGH